MVRGGLVVGRIFRQILNSSRYGFRAQFFSRYHRRNPQALRSIRHPGLVATPWHQHHWDAVPERFHVRPVAGVADESDR